MRVLPAALVLSGLLLSSGPLFASTNTHHRGSAHPVLAHAVSHSTRNSRHASVKAVSHGAVSHRSSAVLMNADRAAQIQGALIKAGYLTGEPTGVWDSQSSAAMQKLQSDNGWQTKLVPDSRALIKLGLGPGSAAPQPFTGGASSESLPAGSPSETASNQ